MKLLTPLSDENISQLKAGDKILLDGKVYTLRDKTHWRLKKELDSGRSFPFDPKGAVIFYAGPVLDKDKRTIRVIGPTTSRRMDSYTPLLLELGIKGMIGKGRRGDKVKEAIKENKAVYFVTYGGAASYLARYVVGARVIAFSELGAEAIFELEVKDFPLVVAIDTEGNDLFEEIISHWK